MWRKIAVVKETYICMQEECEFLKYWRQGKPGAIRGTLRPVTLAHVSFVSQQATQYGNVMAA
jgi:hypothetical protein